MRFGKQQWMLVLGIHFLFWITSKLPLLYELINRNVTFLYLKYYTTWSKHVLILHEYVTLITLFRWCHQVYAAAFRHLQQRTTNYSLKRFQVFALTLHFNKPLRTISLHDSFINCIWLSALDLFVVYFPLPKNDVLIPIIKTSCTSNVINMLHYTNHNIW